MGEIRPLSGAARDGVAKYLDDVSSRREKCISAASRLRRRVI